MLLMRGGVLVTAPLVDFRQSPQSEMVFVARAFARSARSWSPSARPERPRDDARRRHRRGRSSRELLHPTQVREPAAKSDDPNATKRFFVEEQMTATPAVVFILAVIALINHGEMMGDIRRGFTTFFLGDRVFEAIVIGLFSQGTGVFGGLILLDKRENSFCVPVNRASSILAGICASYALYLFLGKRPPSSVELAGAALVVCAIVVLSLPSLLKKRSPPQSEPQSGAL
jgi:hypothetical protein